MVRLPAGALLPRGHISGRGDFSFRVVTPELPAARDEQGRFTKAIRDQQQFSKQLAEILQSQIGRRIQNNLRRPNVSTGRLRRVTMNPSNIRADGFYMGVGNVDYLDRSIAKYWRTIEEGSAATWKRGGMAGMQLRGYFGGSITGWAPVSSWGNQPLAGPRWGAQGGKLRWVWGAPLNPNFVVRREIQPMNAYRDAARDANLDTAGLHAARRFISTALGSELNPPIAEHFLR